MTAILALILVQSCTISVNDGGSGEMLASGTQAQAQMVARLQKLVDELNSRVPGSYLVMGPSPEMAIYKSGPVFYPDVSECRGGGASIDLIYRVVPDTDLRRKAGVIVDIWRSYRWPITQLDDRHAIAEDPLGERDSSKRFVFTSTLSDMGTQLTVQLSGPCAPKDTVGASLMLVPPDPPFEIHPRGR